MFIACVFENAHGHLEKRSIRVRVLSKFTACVAQKEFCVLLISEAVGGDVIGSKIDRFLQCELPLVDGLSRQTEHEIDIDVREPGSSQNVERLLGLL